MLPKNLRLKAKKQINYTFKNGQHIKSDHFFYKYTENKNLKFCVTIAKKFKLNKPLRNRLRRQIFNATSQILNSNPKYKNLNFNIILVLHTIPKDKRFKSFQTEITNFLNQLADEQ